MRAISEAANGWPFLVARGRRTGHRTVLAPDFLTERRLHGQLSDAAHGGDSAPVHQVNVNSPEVGPLTLVYRIERVVAGDLFGDATVEESPAIDEHGRPLELLYGIVTRQRLSGPPDERDLAAAREVALESYWRFLAAEDTHEVDASRAFALHTPLAAPSIDERERNQRAESGELEPHAWGPSNWSRSQPWWRAGLIVAAVLAAIALVLLGMWLLRPSAEVLNTAIVPSQGAVDCRTPVRFELSATVRASRGDL